MVTIITVLSSVLSSVAVSFGELHILSLKNSKRVSGIVYDVLTTVAVMVGLIFVLLTFGMTVRKPYFPVSFLVSDGDNYLCAKQYVSTRV